VNTGTNSSVVVETYSMRTVGQVASNVQRLDAVLARPDLSPSHRELVAEQTLHC